MDRILALINELRAEIDACQPPGRELSLAKTKLDECQLWLFSSSIL